MELAALQKTIINNEQKPFYIFAGMETTIRDVYINQITKRFNLVKVTLESVLQALTTPKNNLFNTRYLYIIKDDKDLLKDETLLTTLLAYTGDCPIVVCYSEFDKRKSAYKKMEEHIVWFNHLEEKQLVPYVEKIIPNESPQFYKDVIYVCENNYGKILLELDKVLTYSRISQQKPSQIFYDMVNEGIIALPPDDEGIAFVEAVVARDTSRVFNMLEEIDPTNTIGLLSLLYNNLKQLYLVYSYSGKGKITDETGLKYFIIKKIQDNRRVYTVDKLEQIMKLIMDTIYGIKQGKISQEYALDYVLTKLF